jgi:hypothetical protein
LLVQLSDVGEFRDLRVGAPKTLKIDRFHAAGRGISKKRHEPPELPIWAARPAMRIQEPDTRCQELDSPS